MGETSLPIQSARPSCDLIYAHVTAYTVLLTMLCFFCRHLIADHLGWFKDSTEEGTLKTIEDLMRAKGEQVRRGSIDGAGTIEYAPE